MALTDQPYLPLYVDDWMNNNKLKMCSPAAHGLMVSIMCIMHKEKTYGRVLLKQKFKQTPSNVKNFALQIAKLSAFDIAEIEKPFDELIAEGSLEIEENYLICPRMVRDFETSEKRAIAGRKGGTTPKIKKQIKAKPQAKGEANTVNEIVIEDVNANAVEKGKEGMGEKPNVVYPFDSDAFAEQWAVWKQYRAKEHRFRFKSVMSEQAALAELGNLANGSETNAIAIMHQSIAKGWKGFFELKNDNGTTKPPAGKGKVQYSDDFKRKIAERLRSG